ncbi:PLP-dependent aminotransferase family protein [Bacillus suaedaesalsae]|uniref:PLP-dependent aminotransferase family protein n=1 Tax=Bacillus suaedaesalsae TaxID=2810349 RepID=A0ABS2DKD8_9BACI|nr:PLP-dependent aminotransferase family protein [Bacillus suaedaesalsae]MBM6618955.1 PLP-dependent aminotransferase family protein [Bacillus suaedaesalsae]
MNVVVNTELKVPLYKQIAQQLELHILNGELAAGSILPTERDLALRIGVNRSTITTAYNELRQTGLVYSKQGSGTVVSEHIWDIVPKNLINWNHSRNVTFTPTQPLTKRILEVSKHPEIINLANGTLPYELPEHQVKQIFSNLSDAYKNESNSFIDWKTREVLSSHLKKDWHLPTSPNNILLTSGINQSMLLLIHCLLNPGDAIAVEGPSYTYTVKLFASFGIKIVKLPVYEDGINPEEVRELYKRHRIRMLMTTPTYQNPTGVVMSLEKRKELLAVSNELKIPIIEFDCTSPLNFATEPVPPSLYELDETNELVIHIGSFTDTLGPNIELGWILGYHTIFEHIKDAKYQMGLGPSRTTMQFTAAYIQSGFWNGNLQTLKDTLSHRSNLLHSFLQQYVGDKITYQRPLGGLNYWCSLNMDLHHENELMEACIHQGVIIVPGTVYGAEKGFVRFSIANSEDNQIEEGVKRFSKALKNIKKYV